MTRTDLTRTEINSNPNRTELKLNQTRFLIKRKKKYFKEIIKERISLMEIISRFKVIKERISHFKWRFPYKGRNKLFQTEFYLKRKE